MQVLNCFRLTNIEHHCIPIFGRILCVDDEVKLVQAVVIVQFLPEPLSEEEIEKVVIRIIESPGASSIKNMGKAMGRNSKQFDGQEDRKTISKIVKNRLSKPSLKTIDACGAPDSSRGHSE